MDQKQDKPDLGESGLDESKDEELVKIVDRHGRRKEIPRSEYEQKKRRKRQREHRSVISLRSVISVALIIAIMIVAVYIAIKIVS